MHQPDATGSTPPQLAMDKGHRYLSRFLADFKRSAHSNAPCQSLCGLYACVMFRFQHA